MSIPFFSKRAPKRSNQPAPAPIPAPVQPSGNTPIRVTDERDGELLNRGYAYWSSAFLGPDGLVTLFVGHADGRPKFFTVDLQSGTVMRLGALLGYGGTSEGWAFDREGNVLLCDGPRLRRVNPFSGLDTVVMDISHDLPGYRLWQPHSSQDGTAHSATVELIVESGAYPRWGTVAQRHGEVIHFPAQGALDESHLDASGRFLVIEEDNGNRLVDLEAREERTLSNAGGALSHMDCGHGFAVGEDDQAGACTYLDLRTLDRRELFKTWNQGVVSVKGGRCIVTDATYVKLVALDGSGVTPLAAHGMSGGDYDRTARASLDPSGRVACWLSNAAGRMDAYVLPVP